MYLTLSVQTRYVGGFWLLLWGVVFAAISCSADVPMVRAIAVAVIFVLMPSLVREPFRAMDKARRANAGIVAAQRSSAFGLQPGDRVAYIGDGIDASWLRLARLSIVSEIPNTLYLGAQPVRHPSPAEQFSNASPRVQQELLEILRKTGAKAAIADSEFAPGNGWDQLSEGIKIKRF
jgi:hypothetical protein